MEKIFCENTKGKQNHKIRILRQEALFREKEIFHNDRRVNTSGRHNYKLICA